MPNAVHLDLEGVTAGDRVGCSAAVLDNWAVVGACTASLFGAQQSGAVHSFQTSTRLGTGLVLPAIAQSGARFGSTLALAQHGSIGLLLVGAVGEDFERGKVHVFQFQLADSHIFSYDFLLDLTPATRTGGDHFGSALAVSGRRVAVGARGPNIYPAGWPQIADGGFVYLFDLLTGEQLAKIHPVDQATGGPLIGCFWFGSAVAFVEGAIAVGAPRAKAPCAPGPRLGAAFVFSDAADQEYNQTAHLLPSEAISGSEQNIEFGSSIALAPTVWRRSAPSTDMAVVIGAPGALVGRGAVYVVGPFSASSSSRHVELNDTRAWAPRTIAPAYLGLAPRFGSLLTVDAASGLALIAAENGFTRHGNSGAVLRTWLLHHTASPLSTALDQAGSSTSSSLPPPAAPLPLQSVEEGFLWGPTANPGDGFGSAVALSSSGFAVCGASSRNDRATDGTTMLFSGAAYAYNPTIISLTEEPTRPPSTPPPSQPPPGNPPGAPPPPPDLTGYGVLGILFGILLIGGALWWVRKWRQHISTSAERRRMLLAAIRLRPTSEASIADQLQQIVTEDALRVVDIFRSWDEDGSGSVSRKEFRRALLKLGYDAPRADLDRAFDEFDLDGSGEIDLDEFRQALHRSQTALAKRTAVRDAVQAAKPLPRSGVTTPGLGAMFSMLRQQRQACRAARSLQAGAGVSPSLSSPSSPWGRRVQVESLQVEDIAEEHGKACGGYLFAGGVATPMPPARVGPNPGAAMLNSPGSLPRPPPLSKGATSSGWRVTARLQASGEVSLGSGATATRQIQVMAQRQLDLRSEMEELQRKLASTVGELQSIQGAGTGES
jgi:hypothetical protein